MPRVDDRRVISGIIHVLKSGCRWVNAPAVYGPRKTLYNRFVRWAAKGVWVNIFRTLAMAGGKGGQSGDRPLARRMDHENPRADRSASAGRSHSG